MNGGSTGGGARVTLTAKQLEDARKSAAKAAAAAAAGKPVAHWEYKTEVNCIEGGDAGCATSAAACDNGQFQSRVLRRMVGPDGKPVKGADGSWAAWGLTCFPEQIPGNRLPSLAQIQQAFRQIDFAKGGLSIQPVGNVTLVNLPTYFQTTWPGTGVQAGDTDTTTLMGYRLEIQPVLRGLVYVYGDGNSSEPTDSLGGKYPDGDITWTYKSTGTYPIRVDTTYGGRFRLEGGPWIEIPGTVTVEGAPQNLIVKEAKARLVTR